MIEFRNNSGLAFSSLESELWRSYTFPGGDVVTINDPQYLNVSSSGGHRVFDAGGISHYIPKGWIHLTWSVKEDQPHFDF